MRGREGSFVLGKEGKERGKIRKKKFAAGRNRLIEKEHGINEQLDYKEGKGNNFKGSNRKKGRTLQRISMSKPASRKDG